MVSAAPERKLPLIAHARMIAGMVHLVTYTRFIRALVTGHFTLQKHAISILVSAAVARFSGHETVEASMRGEV